MRLSSGLVVLGALLPLGWAAEHSDVILARNSSLTCGDVGLVPKSDRCQFVKNQCDGDEYRLGVFNYLQMYYCTEVKAVPVAFSGLTLVLSFFSLGLTASDYLCPNLYTISKFLDLSDNLAGLTLLAVGNSAPDVLGTYKALEIGSAGLAVSELVGAALFILTVVVGSICLASPFKVPQYHFMRDIIFYMAVSVVILLSLLAGQFNILNCVLLASIYVIYVIVAVFSHSWLRRKMKRKMKTATIMSHYDAEHSPTFIGNEEPSYFDQIHTLPSIDVLSTNSSEEVQEARDELGNYLKTHPAEGSEERAPLETGTYGLRVLLRELSRHSIHVQPPPQARIQLESETRPLSAAAVPETPEHDYHGAQNLEVPGPGPNTNETEVVEESKLSRIGKQFLPDFGTEVSWYFRMAYILCAPANVLLKLTTPNRERAVEFGMHNARSSNAFTFQFADQESQNEEFGDYDFEADLEIFRIQLVAGTLMFMLVSFSPASEYWIYTTIALVIACVLSLLVPTRAPKFERHLLSYRILNYLGSVFGFGLALMWVSIFASEIIAIIKAISVVLQFSDDILGATVFALGNSIGDLISNLTIARMGMPVMAFAACFGGPLLALCSLGLSSIIVISRKEVPAIYVNFSPTLKLNLSILLASQAFLILFVPRNDWKFDRKVGVTLIGFWILSVIFSILLEV